MTALRSRFAYRGVIVTSPVLSERWSDPSGSIVAEQHPCSRPPGAEGRVAPPVPSSPSSAISRCKTNSRRHCFSSGSISRTAATREPFASPTHLGDKRRTALPWNCP